MDEGIRLNIQSSSSGSLSHLMALFRKCVSNEMERMDRLASISACLQTSPMMTIYRKKRVHKHTSTYLQLADREKEKWYCTLSKAPPCNDSQSTCVLNTLSTDLTVNEWFTQKMIWGCYCYSDWLALTLLIHSVYKIANSHSLFMQIQGDLITKNTPMAIFCNCQILVFSVSLLTELAKSRI